MPRNPNAPPEARAAAAVLGSRGWAGTKRERAAVDALKRLGAVKRVAAAKGVGQALELLAILYDIAEQGLDAKLPQVRPKTDRGIGDGKTHVTAPAGLVQGIAGGERDPASANTQGYSQETSPENSQFPSDDIAALPEILRRREVTPIEAWDHLNKGLALLQAAEAQQEGEGEREYWYRQVRRYQRSLELYNEYYRANRDVDKSAQVIMVLLKHAKEMYIGGKVGRAPIMEDAMMAAHEDEAAGMSDEELAAAMGTGKDERDKT